MKKFLIIPITLVSLLMTGCSQQSQSAHNHSANSSQNTQQLQKNVNNLQRQVDTKKAKLKKLHYQLKNSSNLKLSDLNYDGNQEVEVDHNNPHFAPSELNHKSPWLRFNNLDHLNRATDANGMLNIKTMPTKKREPLTFNPTGWHNKRINNGWLYNRSHLIGYQLCGENNNPKNLITGTRTLNAPLMLYHEDDIATYLKQNRNNYVRYQVTPIYRGNELVSRGVQMRAQSVGNNQIHFNVYIFNVEPGYNIDYQNGYSTKG
ncbi:DNA/RNA non-specific endonuclease [Fructilactobacillus fructivorans]|uniref:DNA-entry nuclease (Competence-specific nuclease) n=1 Tax=Fructilactobacillus fructivorans TaxID=1614 RepID=A0A0C1PRY6_9LACO|nr:DNA/RNA non-specific endonuclease [Fructilactobacillus fructivorans]KID42646.1 DNA-entry nuclease (Competence-specific nuclease) [Fructilactobacillus fructivorans]MCT0151872.1 DNA/RNA endonuclease [Fructilactobacillus fructivorans]MCT2867999.1 DNA/RNA endonuclease [Fructilactobacillus fructivorans]MCT2868651.1 DNA/RNA endonuclease [Fructilactobacillus fructivorans]MCT2873418.1 DNA/RNA endonuclease [Fructilactobacillus fructivorans]